MFPWQYKRKSEPSSSKPAGKKSSKSTATNSSSPQKDKTLRGVNKLFDRYANKSSGIIEPEGIELLCSDLGVPIYDVKILMLAWKMKAEKQGYFTQEEWIRGLKDCKVDDMSKMQNYLSVLENEVSPMQENFGDFYSFAFDFCLTEERQNTLDLECVGTLLSIILGSKFNLQAESFTKYLHFQKDYKLITRDMWIGFLRFCQNISFPDLKNYDENEAWPTILDNFVTWLTTQATDPP